MSGERLSARLRQEVIRRASGHCEYCQVHEEDGFFPHEPDHIIAVQHGGETVLENLALSCFHCNRHKGPNLSSLDPQTRQITALFNPRTDAWENHFHSSQGVIESLTPVGRATSALLSFNIPERVRLRQLLQATGRWPA